MLANRPLYNVSESETGSLPGYNGRGISPDFMRLPETRIFVGHVCFYMPPKLGTY